MPALPLFLPIFKIHGYESTFNVPGVGVDEGTLMSNRYSNCITGLADGNLTNINHSTI